MNFSPILKNREVIASITPSLRYSAENDFKCWQTSAREKLIELLGLNELVKCDPCFQIEETSETDTYKEYRFRIQSEEDFFFTCTLRVPIRLTGKLPVAVCLCGHSDDMASSLSEEAENDRNIVSRALKEGYCAMLVELRNFDNCFAITNSIPEQEKSRVSWNSCFRSSMRAVMLGRTTLGERVWDIMRAIDALLGNFECVDENAICLIGDSGCGTIAYYTACVDERVAMTVSSSGVCSWEDSIMALSHCTCNYVPKIANYFAMGDLGGLIAPRKLVVISEKDDKWFPEAGVRSCYEQVSAVYSAIGESSSTRLHIMDGARRFYADVAWDDIHTMLK